MQYFDRVYGKFEINDPLILELIECSSMQRLKGIDQAGYRALWAKPDADCTDEEHSRFAHSVGVYLLLRKYDAPLAEQVSGLLHDISHTAFSHCIDYILASGSEKEQNHQDNSFATFVRNSEIPGILEKYGIDVDYILNDEHFPLKETTLPDICADRIDYSLRTAVLFGEITNADVEVFLENLKVDNQRWVFQDFEIAKKYAELFRKISNVYYSDFPSARMFRLLADCLRYALEKSYIAESDLYTVDRLVIDKVQSFVDQDEKLKLLLARMNNKDSVKNDPTDYDVTVFCKSRMIDPLCLVDGAVKRVSDVDPSWGDIVRAESKPKQYFLKFLE